MQKVTAWLKKHWQPVLAIAIAAVLFFVLFLHRSRTAASPSAYVTSPGPGGGAGGSGGTGSAGAGSSSTDPVAAFKQWFTPASRADLRPQSGKSIADYIHAVLAEFTAETGLTVDLPSIYQLIIAAFQSFGAPAKTGPTADDLQKASTGAGPSITISTPGVGSGSWTVSPDLGPSKGPLPRIGGGDASMGPAQDTPGGAGSTTGPYGPAYFVHVVQAGDTLWSLAVRHLHNGLRWHEIKGYDGDPRKLPIGTTLWIPKTGSPEQLYAAKVPEGPFGAVDVIKQRKALTGKVHTVATSGYKPRRLAAVPYQLPRAPATIAQQAAGGDAIASAASSFGDGVQGIINHPRVVLGSAQVRKKIGRVGLAIKGRLG